MKKVLFLLIAAFVLASCGTSRKVTKDVVEYALDSTENHVAKTETTDKVVDTTRTQTGEIIITEIEFFNNGDVKTDSSGGNPDADTELDLPGIGKVKGSVKSVKQTQIKKTDERKGESKETKKKDEKQDNANLVRTGKEEHKDSTPVPDPYRWRYIAFIVAVILAAIVLLYMKRQPFVRTIKNFIARIRGFLK